MLLLLFGLVYFSSGQNLTISELFAKMTGSGFLRGPWKGYGSAKVKYPLKSSNSDFLIIKMEIAIPYL